MGRFFIIVSFLVSLIYAEPVRIMLVGDSITYDDAYIDHPNPRPTSLRNGYRNDLWYKLDEGGYWVDFVGSRIAGEAIIPAFDPDNEGYPGETSYDIADKIYNKLVQNPTDIILLYIGANDWSESTAGINEILNNIDSYERDYYHHVKVILARIANRQTYQPWMTQLNYNIQTLANQRIINGDDIYVVDMEYSAGINYSTDFQDPTHPNDVGYAKIAGVWYDALKKFIKPSDKYSWLIPITTMLLSD